MLSVSIETSVVSYLKQRPAAHVVAAARQLLTRRWWDEERANYELVTSQYVIDEASLGDPTLAGERLEYLRDLPLLALDNEIQNIADEIMSRAILPKKAQFDALHIAIAAFHRVDYLLTWNCTHIANARILPRIHAVLNDLGQTIPLIGTPEEMVDDDTQLFQ